MTRLLPPALAALTIASCLAFHPQPIDPEHVESALRARTLTDHGLCAYLETQPSAQRTCPLREIDLPTLTLVAFYFHPDLDVARAAVGMAEAGIVTAGARPNPRVGISGGRADASELPWLYGITFDIPIETADKRGYRLARAEHLTDAARLELAETGWKVRSRLRVTVVNYLLALRAVALLQADETVQAAALLVMEQRLAAGEVSRPDVDTTRAERMSTLVALRAAHGSVAERRVALAAALGLPVSALENVTVTWADLDRPRSEPVLSAASQRAGLLNRLDVRRTLAEYAAVEAALQLEVAKQYPDVHLGPGYKFDDSRNKFELGVSLTLPLLDQNQGPIAEAVARREAAAARFLALQAQVIAETEQAVERYRAATRELQEANELLAALYTQVRALQHAVALGEADRLALTGVQLQRTRAARVRLDTLGKVQSALGALEDAVQHPLDADVPLPAVPEHGAASVARTAESPSTVPGGKR